MVDGLKLSKAIATRMVAARKKTKPPISQSDLGRILGMTRGGVANIEAGRQRILIEHIYNAAAAFRVPVASLLPPL
jgi:transcriptional regulator with XRE-family HTH domain